MLLHGDKSSETAGSISVVVFDNAFPNPHHDPISVLLTQTETLVQLQTDSKSKKTKETAVQKTRQCVHVIMLNTVTGDMLQPEVQ